MGREIIQIVVAPSGQVIALCDDSSIWIKHDGWRRLADIPQDDEKPSAYQCPVDGCSNRVSLYKEVCAECIKTEDENNGG